MSLLHLLFTTNVHAEIVLDKTLKFAGVWEYQGRTSLEGRDYAVVFRYTIFQKARRICGFLEHSGAPNRTVEQYSFKGIVHANYANVWIDSGTPRSADYVPIYPFQPEEIVRLRISANHMLMGSVFQEHFPPNLVFPKRDSDIIYVKELRLTHVAATRPPEEVFSWDPIAAKTYIARCLDDETNSDERVEPQAR